MQRLFTRGMRVNVSNMRETLYGSVPAYWGELVLERCAFVQTGAAKGRNFRGKDTIELPYLRVANVQDGHLDLSEMKHIHILKTEAERYRLQPGDVVLTEGGDFDKLGRGFIWSNQIPNCVHQNHIFAVRPNKDLLLSEYFAYLIQSGALC
jgi:type I restriction enzyme S subunit